MSSPDERILGIIFSAKFYSVSFGIHPFPELFFSISFVMSFPSVIIYSGPYLSSLIVPVPYRKYIRESES